MKRRLKASFADLQQAACLCCGEGEVYSMEEPTTPISPAPPGGVRIFSWNSPSIRSDGYDPRPYGSGDANHSRCQYEYSNTPHILQNGSPGHSQIVPKDGDIQLRNPNMVLSVPTQNGRTLYRSRSMELNCQKSGNDETFQYTNKAFQEPNGMAIL